MTVFFHPTNKFTANIGEMIKRKKWCRFELRQSHDRSAHRADLRFNLNVSSTSGMDLLQILILALVQGAAELLPVSMPAPSGIWSGPACSA